MKARELILPPTHRQTEYHDGKESQFEEDRALFDALVEVSVATAASIDDAEASKIIFKHPNGAVQSRVRFDYNKIKEALSSLEALLTESEGE